MIVMDYDLGLRFARKLRFQFTVHRGVGEFKIGPKIDFFLPECNLSLSCFTLPEFERKIQLIGRLYDSIIITITDHDKGVSHNKILLKAANSDD